MKPEKEKEEDTTKMKGKINYGRSGGREETFK